MKFRDVLEREITSQGLSVAEVARASGLSKGAIYNILNGSTEDARIRPATRRALAQGCNRELHVLEDGSARFEEGVEAPTAPVSDALTMRLVPERPFLESRFVREAFDWLHEQEEQGALAGVGAVDRVFQRRSDFLSLEVENQGTVGLSEVRFDLGVTYAGSGPAASFPVRIPAHALPSERVEVTVFLSVGPPFCLQVRSPSFSDVEGQSGSLRGDIEFVH